MSFILSCDFLFCCGGANDPECQQPPPYAEPTHPQTQVVTVMQSPGQLPPPISSNQLPPPLPAPALPPTIVYNMHPPGITPLPHVPNHELYYYLPPPNMDIPAWPSAPPSHVPSFSKEYIVPQPATHQPPCHSNKPSNAYDLFPQSTQMIPSSQVPSTKVHEPVTSGPPPQADHSAIQPSNRYQTPSITNQQWAPPIVPPKRPETIVPTLVPMDTPAPAPSKVHNPLQQSKQTALHSDTCDEPPQSHITTQPPPQASVFPARQPSKTYQNLPSMNQQSMSHVPSKRCDNPVPAVAPEHAHPPVPTSKVPAPLPQSKKAVPSSVLSTKVPDVPRPAQVPSQPPPGSMACPSCI